MRILKVPQTEIPHRVRPTRCRSAASGATVVSDWLDAPAPLVGCSGLLDRIFKCDSPTLPKGCSCFLDSTQELRMMLQPIVEPVVF